MPVVLRLERPPAARTPVLEAAARAALAVCLDPRAEPDGEWHEAVATWIDARIRKIARRARGAHWAAVQELPGVTVAVDDAQARALLPGPVDDVPKVVSRLQIGGTDLPDDQPGLPAPGVPVIWVNGALAMTVGKAAAQVGHASMLDAAARGLPRCRPTPCGPPRRPRGRELCHAVGPRRGRGGARRGLHRGRAGHDHGDHDAGLKGGGAGGLDRSTVHAPPPDAPLPGAWRGPGAPIRTLPGGSCGSVDAV